ncbi:HAD-IIB family hydrolase [Thiohalobacter sp.]|uniref:HAD-IIB family hydrolase n=1 Tax=Thiohalobacter sp. TaxID=2025948 RepID=UPI002627CD7E|nr:HAD-IIB family hydrolase [Thiohalobacter sp.]
MPRYDTRCFPFETSETPRARAMATDERILLCTDLDRTLLPNGPAPESPLARPLFHHLVEHEPLLLAYVSGRNRSLIEAAIREWDLPLPDYAVADVGTTIHRPQAGEWQVWEPWWTHIGRAWGRRTAADLAPLFDDFEELAPQAPEHQGRYKLSFHAPADTDHAALLARMQRRLGEQGLRASLVWSVDETRPIGLVDVLPPDADKLGAIRFLMRELGLGPEQLLFAGDSGNDLPVLASEIPAVLVANASDAVREAAEWAAHEAGHDDRLYPARGLSDDLNGNYAAGIIEGLVHYHPRMAEAVRRHLAHLQTSGS